MAESTIIQYPAGQSQYDIPFDYLARKFVKVSFVSSTDPSQNRELTLGVDFQFLSERVIELLVEPTNQDIVQLRRFTDVELLVDFRDGSVLTANDLTTSELQAIHLAEEGRDQTYGLAQQFADEAKDAAEEAKETLDEIMAQAQWGYKVVGSFELGVPDPGVTLKNQVVSYGLGDNLAYYIWEGELPKAVPENSTPQLTGGIGKGAWVYVGYNINVIEAQLQGVIPPKNEPMARTNMEELYKRDDTNVWRFSTWNLQGWNSAHVNGGKDLASDLLQSYRQERILNARVDFCGMQECLYSAWHPVSTLAIYPMVNTFFGPADWGGHQDLSGYKYGNSFISRGTVTGATFKVYDDRTADPADPELRSYTKCYVTRGAVKVAVYVTHLSLLKSRRDNMLAELLTAAKAETGPVVVMGDFDTEDMAEFAGFVSEGFTIGNNREVSTHPTPPTTWYIDNILYRGFARRVSITAQEHFTGLSDHKMLIIELEVQ